MCFPADDMTTPTAKEGLQAAGINSILPKEQSANYVVLPILKTYAEKENVSFRTMFSFNTGLEIVRKTACPLQGSHRLEKYLNVQDCLEKSLNFTINRRIQRCLWGHKSV